MWLLLWFGCVSSPPSWRAAPPPEPNAFLWIGPLSEDGIATMEVRARQPHTDVEVYQADDMGAARCLQSACTRLQRPWIIDGGQTDDAGVWVGQITDSQLAAGVYLQALVRGSAPATSNLFVHSDNLCRDDAMEPNDTLDEAVVITGSLDDLRVCDEDWYQVTVDPGETLRVMERTHGRLTDSGPERTVAVMLYESYLQQTTRPVWTNDQDDPQDVYIRVEPGTAPVGRYDLDVAIGTHGACDSSASNDTQATAHPLDASSVVRQHLCEGQTRWFEVTPPPGERLTITAETSSMDGDVSVELIRGATSVVGTSPGRVSIEPGGPVTVAVTVYRDDMFLADGVEFELSLQTFVEGSCLHDRYEPNNSAATAVGMPLHRPVYGVLCARDEDFYRLYLGEGEGVDIGLHTPRATPSSLWATLEDPDGNLIWSTSAGHTRGARARVQGEHILRVYAAGSADSDVPGEPYTLRAGAAASCLADRWEPNAVPLDDGDTIELSRCDDSDADEITIDLQPSQSVLVRALHEDGSAIVPTITGTSGRLRTIDFRGQRASAYRSDVHDTVVATFPRTAVQLGRYSVAIDIVEPAPCVPFDPLGPNNTLLLAPNLTTNTLEATVCEGDSDWYHLPAIAGEHVVVTAENLEERDDVGLWIIDGAGVELAQGTGFVIAPYVHGPVYLVVRGVDAGEGGGIPYTLHVERRVLDPCIPDPFEPNDTPITSVDLPIGEHELTMCSHVDDWYDITVPAGGRYAVTMDEPPPGATVSLTFTSGFVVPFYSGVRLGPGVSRIHVSYVDPTLQQINWPYTIRVANDLCAEDALEPDSDRDDATAQDTLDATLCLRDDDWSAFEALHGDMIELSLAWPDNGERVRATIEGPSGRLATVASEGGTLLLEARAMASGTHWVELSLEADDLQGGGIDYTGTILTAPWGACPLDPHEPDDIAASATPLVLGAQHAGVACVGNDDWLSVQTGPVGVWVDADVPVEAFDGTESLGLDEAVEGALAERLLRVHSPQSSAPDLGTDYAVTVWPLSACGLLGEPDDLLVDAHELVVGDVFDGEACSDDVDVFSVPLLGGQSLTASVHVAGAPPVELSLLVDGVLLHQTSVDGPFLDYATAIDEVVELRVEGPSAPFAFGVPYSLEVTP